MSVTQEEALGIAQRRNNAARAHFHSTFCAGILSSMNFDKDSIKLEQYIRDHPDAPAPQVQEAMQALNEWADRKKIGQPPMLGATSQRLYNTIAAALSAQPAQGGVVVKIYDIESCLERDGIHLSYTTLVTEVLNITSPGTYRIYPAVKIEPERTDADVLREIAVKLREHGIGDLATEAERIAEKVEKESAQR